MPYKESFVKENGNPGISTATFDEAVDGMCRWGIMTDGLIGFDSADNDGAFIALESPYTETIGRFYTGKINLGNSTSPTLSLMLYNPDAAGTNPSNNKVEFKVYSYMDNRWHSLGEPRTVAELTGGRYGWNKVNVDLSDYADQRRYLRFGCLHRQLHVHGSRQPQSQRTRCQRSRHPELLTACQRGSRRSVRRHCEHRQRWSSGRHSRNYRNVCRRRTRHICSRHKYRSWKDRSGHSDPLLPLS